MTKKDYKAIGKALHAQISSRVAGGHGLDAKFVDYSDTFWTITRSIAVVFQANNLLFDRARFLRFVETGRDTK